MDSSAIAIDGVPIVIRPMGADYLMADQEPKGVEVAVGCRVCAKPEQWPNPMYVAYYGKLTAAYGACAILAWQDQTVVGFLPFVPAQCGIDLPFCLHYVDEEGMADVKAFSPVPKDDMSPRALRTHCLSVKQAMRRKGLGSQMVRYLVAWARANEWQRIAGWAFEKSDFGWLPDIVFWERCGFKRGKGRGWDEHITDPGFEYCMEL